MNLTYIGHACFLVQSDAGLRILLDPYQPGAFGGKFALKPFTERVDVLVSTHEHLDHWHLDPAFGSPEVVRSPRRAAGIAFHGVRLPHDAEGGARRGFVTGFRFEVDGVSIVHPGDLGRPFTAAEVAELAPADVLLLPVGGTFTVGPEDAATAVKALRPRVVIPMHYKWPTVDLPLLPVEDFLAEANRKGWEVERARTQPLVFAKDTLPAATTVLLLPPTH